MALNVPITNRIRKYGYIYWIKEQDDEVKRFLRNVDKIKIWFENSYLGEKKIDWKYRRISIGWSKTRSLPEDARELQLRRRTDGAVMVVCK